jgi:hypothetical protein
MCCCSGKTHLDARPTSALFQLVAVIEQHLLATHVDYIGQRIAATEFAER